ncbi:uncharacterized protein LOC119693499 isoform X2 [Plutella xylostella]|uniref:uncharacterized protein LOC119693499 isoform X2 n=1 Tax=Plutella xylostella TaxID=51655 RepID=UPI0020324342|nr:uncharacterized protein LOC119693499 isoform X2 [Plutella xylostella]
MLFNTISCKKLIAIFVVILVLVCSCDSFKIKVKRKVQDFRHVSGNKLKDYSENSTDAASGRGFFPPGSIFTLGKVLNFFPVGGERECQPSHGFTARSGICLNPYDCRQRDGRAGGDCAHGLGVCCVFEVTCGGTVQNNLTYFMSPGFPELWGGRGDCNVTIEKAHAGIMQLRIDFVHFSIGQPNRATGECDEDVMTLGEEGNQFRVCGQNHGQHIYHTLSTDTEAREADELAGHRRTQLSVAARGSLVPRLWLLKIAQMPLANAAPHQCKQYFTADNGTISTFNFAINGRYLANHQYQACVRRSAGACSIRYAPCAPRSFRIGPGGGVQTYGAAAFPSAPGSLGGAGGGFYGPEGAFTMVPLATAAPLATAGMDQQAAENDPIVEEGMMPVMDQVQEDDMEGSGADPQIASMDAPVTPVPSMASRSSRGFSTPKTWGFWSPYAQHYLREDDDFRYQGYGNFGLDLRGFGRQHCQDRITIPCDNEYFVSNSSLMNGVCDPHHCGQTFCPGAPFDRCYVQSSVSPFSVSVNFGPPVVQRSAEENIGACLMYQQLPCDV